MTIFHKFGRYHIETFKWDAVNTQGVFENLTTGSIRWIEEALNELQVDGSHNYFLDFLGIPILSAMISSEIQKSCSQ